MTGLPLASEFPPATREAWLKLVEKTLKGGSLDTIASVTGDGLRIEPLYERAKNADPVAGRKAGSRWAIVQRVDHPNADEANKEALHDLENGASGLALVFSGAPSANGFGIAEADEKTLARILQNVWLDAVSIRLDSRPRAFKAADSFLKVAEERDIEFSKLDVALGIDPLGALAALGGIPEPAEEGIAKRAEFAASLVKRGFSGQTFIADGRPVHDAGGSEAQELAWVVACAVTYLRALESAALSLQQASAQIAFLMSADADQFLTIAKFRALRKLWARVEEASDIEQKPIRLHAETAWRMMTKTDAQVNWLRTTIAAFAAGTGGADVVSVLPHSAAHGFPDRFARRVARNMQLLLTDESDVHRVSDPAAGSGAIEDLTEKLCVAAWKKFQEIEAAGGAFPSLGKGKIQQEIAAVREDRLQALADGKDALIGTTVFKNPKDAAPAVVEINKPASPTFKPAVQVEPLPRIRLGERFE